MSDLLQKSLDLPFWGLLVVAGFSLLIGGAAAVFLFRRSTPHRRIKQDLAMALDHLMRAEEIAGLGHWHVVLGQFGRGDDEVPWEVLWSAQVYRIFGYEPYAFTPTVDRFLEGIHEDERPGVTALLKRLTAKGQGFEGEFRVERPDKSLRHVYLRAETEKSEGVPRLMEPGARKPGSGGFWGRKRNRPAAIAYFGTLQDVTDRVRAEKEMRAQEQRIQLLFETSGSGIVSIDPTGICTSCNPAAVSMLGFQSAGALIGSTVARDLFSAKTDQGDDPQEVCPVIETTLQGYPYSGTQDVFRRADGSEFPVQVHANPIRGPEGIEGAVITFVDISTLKDLEAQLYRQANHDALTQLPNRLLMTDRLERAMRQTDRRGGFVGVLFLDLDDFKKINDTLGHRVGDDVLKLVARRISSTVRTGDTVARLGGDEFVVVLPHLTNPLDAANLAERITVAIQQPMSLEGMEIRIGASMGIAVYPFDGQDMDTLLKAADTALYETKDCDRGRFRYFAAPFSQAAERQHSVEQQVKKAFAQGKSLVHYQPIVDANTGRTTGLEALLRFGPDRALRGINIADAIKVAERNGFMIEIGQKIMSTAVGDMADLIRVTGAPLDLNLNVSVRQIIDAHFVVNLLQCLEKYGLQPENLVVEITETILIRSPKEVLEILSRLRSHGIRVALDDFGTGYSSLSYLASFPVDITKIDRSFMVDSDQQSHKMQLLRSMVDLSRNLKQEIVCEGIESRQQAVLAAEFGAQKLQGFHLGRPASINAIRQRILLELNAQQQRSTA